MKLGMKLRENFKTYLSNEFNGGIQYKIFYSNGYGASVVKHQFSYGNEQGLWELAVLKGNKDKWNICYTTLITSDVLGNLSEIEVNKTLDKIKLL